MGKVQVEADIPQTVNYVATTVNIGATTTLDPGSNATVTNSGTESNAIFNFGIPRGKSAYEQAVEGGYAGTEEEFELALASDIATVADNISDINTVGQSIADVNAVADTLSDVSVVANIATEVSTVSSISSDVAQVSSIATDVSNVADNNTNITAVASDLTNIDTAATNIAAIIAAPAAATNAATSATNAQTWAEGADSAVTLLDGEHSSKGWANIAKQYAESIGAALKYKGSVSTYSALPSTGQEIGDMWNVSDTGKNYAWTGTEWDDLAGVVDLSAYRTAAQQDLIDATKQDTLVSGTNIKTVNGNSLLGSGNVDIDALPDQTGQSGKFLTTDGTDPSWAEIPTDVDNKSVSLNSNDEIQTIGVIDQNDTTKAIKTWTGTKAEYEAIATKDPDTDYTITDDQSLPTVASANADLSNLSNTGKSVVDGAYVAKFYRLVQGGSIAGGATTTYDLSSYLPNDGQVYEVWGSMRGSSNQNLTYDIGISTTAMNNAGVLRVVSGYTTTASSGAYVAIVGTGRDLSLVNLNANNVFNIVVIDLFGYRRIGTNA